MPRPSGLAPVAGTPVPAAPAATAGSSSSFRLLPAAATGASSANLARRPPALLGMTDWPAAGLWVRPLVPAGSERPTGRSSWGAQLMPVTAAQEVEVSTGQTETPAQGLREHLGPYRGEGCASAPAPGQKPCP